MNELVRSKCISCSIELESSFGWRYLQKSTLVGDLYFDDLLLEEFMIVEKILLVLLAEVFHCTLQISTVAVYPSLG